MLENLVRGLGNVRKWGSGDCKCQQMRFEGLEILENGVRGFGNVRILGSKTWKLHKVGFEGL